MNPRLFPFQRRGAQWLAGKAAAILADDMGVGKTSQAIGGADLIGAASILVLVPGIARVNWVREFEMWQTVPRTVGAIMTGKDRPKTQVVICSYSLARQLGVLTFLIAHEWDLLILDEAQTLKSDVALVSRCVYGNKFDRTHGIIASCKRVWLLSGTIAPNHPGEIWTHCASLFPDVLRGRTYPDWVRDYCEVDPFSKLVVGYSEAGKYDLPKLLAPHILRRTMTQVFPEMPPLRFSQVVVHPEKLPPKSREVAETELIVEAAIAKADAGESEEARMILAELDEMHLSSLVKWTGVAKAPAIAEFVANELANGLDKVVIFALHREVFATLETIIPDTVCIHGDTPNKRRQELIDGFQGKVPGFSPKGLILHTRIASTALTLTAARDVVFAETPWVPADIQQAAKRCHRLGQTRAVLARVFSLRDSVDEKIGKTLVRKIRSTTAFEAGITEQRRTA
jgi:SNF2 family DNA or RNA helicase